MSASLFMVVVLVAWAVIGAVVSYVLARRGHDLFSWWMIGVVFGPLVVPLALDAIRRERLAGGIAVVPGVAGSGPVDVLVGVDGSPESLAAVREVVEVLGPRLGRLTLATVLHFEAGEAAREGRPGGAEMAGRRILGEVAASVAGPRPDTVILWGDPADALLKHAEDIGYDVVAVGHRGRGLAEALLGSVATRLARSARKPVLIGGR